MISERRASVMKALLNSDRDSWSLRDVANEAKVSYGWVYHVVHELLHYGYMHRDENNRLRLINKDKILVLLRQTSNIYAAIDLNLLLPLSPEATGHLLQEIQEKKGLRYAVSGSLGLWLLYKYVPPTEVHTYVQSKKLKIWHDCLMDRGASTSRTRVNANLFLIGTKEDFILDQAQKIGDIYVAPTIQVYLDCLNIGARYAEVAEDVFGKAFK